jgi:hypothetical protein
VQLVNDVYTWIDRVFYYVSLAFCAWALIDCAFRKARAFPAVNKLTKVIWIAILVVAGAVDYFVGGFSFVGSAAIIASLVYLFDVRPAVREISGGSR